MARRALLLAALLAHPGCATDRPVQRVTDHHRRAWASAETRDATRSPFPGLTPEDELAPHSSRTIPGRVGCLIQLANLGVPHRHLRALRGVDTPVAITGPIGGIHYRPMGRHRLVGDCRLALALHRAAPYLRNIGVTDVYFSSAYSYRLAPSGALSRHARGLAIDVHRVRTTDDGLLEISEDFELGLEVGEGCALNAPALNRMACLLAEWRIFDRVLTPDFDRAHYNHLHLAILEQRR
jgi:hypothetical protein